MKTTGILLAICLLFSFQQERSLLDIELSTIRNHKGVVRLSFYTAKQQYPRNPFKTYEVKKDSLVNGRLHYQITDLKPGRYGLCFLDDENLSGDMESNIFGVPKEGFGFSNNVKPFLKCPDFESILFNLAPGKNHMQLIVRY